MMRLLRTHLLPALAVVTTLLCGAAVADSRPSPPIWTVFEVKKPWSWFENMAIRASGHILATRVDLPEIWAVDPFARTGALLVTVPGVEALLGIAETRPDVFVFAASNFSLRGPDAGWQPNSTQLWELDFRGRPCAAGPPPTARRVAEMPAAGVPNGLAAWDESAVVVADSTYGQVIMVDVATGESTTVIRDPTMARTANVSVGINGLKVFEQGGRRFVYYTSQAQALFCRIPVDARTGRPTGPAEVIARGFAMDDFTLRPDGTALVASNADNVITEVAPDGRHATVAGSPGSLALASDSSCLFGRTERDRDILYVTTAGGFLTPVNGTLRRPADIAAVDFGALKGGW